MGSALSVIVLDVGSPAGEIATYLQELGHRVLRLTDVRVAIQEAARLRWEALLVPGTSLSAVREARQQASLSTDALPIMAVCTGVSVEELESYRVEADEVLCWPAGRGHLLHRLDAMIWIKEQQQEARLRQIHARVLQEMATTLATQYEYEDKLLDVLLRMVEISCARNGLVLVNGEDESVYYLMGSSDDPSAVRMPVLRAAHPEVIEAHKTLCPLVIKVDQDQPGGGPIPLALRERGLLATWVFPLIWEGEAYGAVELGFDDEAPLSAATADLVREVSQLIAFSLRESEIFTGLREQTHKKVTVTTEARRQLEVLQKYEEFFQRAFDGIVVLDRELTVLHLNPAGEQITGYARRGLVGQSLLEIVDPPFRPVLVEQLAKVSEKGLGHVFDLRLVTTSGDPILVSISPSSVLEDGAMIVASFRDVSEARLLENELRSTKEFLERLIDSMVDAIVATDIDGLVILFNQGAERIFGHDAEEIIGKRRLSDLYPPVMAERLMAHLRGPEDGGFGRLEAVRLEVQSAAGELVPVTLSANLIYEDGEEVGTVGIYSDLREKLRIEQTLAQAQEKLIETEKQALIAELAGTTAHELNQPLTSIMGYAELLKRRIPQDDSNHRAVDTILSEAERMAEIVRKIGKITRYETKAYVGGAQILDLEKSSG